MLNSCTHIEEVEGMQKKFDAITNLVVNYKATSL